MEHQDNQQAPATLLPAVLNHLGLSNTPLPTDEMPLESLLAALEDADWHTRVAALNALAKNPSSVPLAPLVRALHDNDASVRAAAVSTLGRRNEHSLTKYVLEALHDSEWLVREAAVLTLA